MRNSAATRLHLTSEEAEKEKGKARAWKNCVAKSKNGVENMEKHCEITAKLNKSSTANGC